MKRLLAITLAASLASSVLAGPATDPAQAPAAREVPPNEFAGPSNAALVYYRAWLLADAAAWEAVVRNDDPAPLGDLQASIDHLLAAAAIAQCDWGPDYEAGPWALLPHLSKLRDSARLLKADAARLAAAGDMDGAVERLAAIFRMSEHTRRDRMLISALVGAAISGLACDATDEIVGHNPITAAQARRLLAAAELPADPFGVKAAIRGEGVAFVGWAKEHLTGPDAARQLAQIVAIDQPAADDPILQMSAVQIGRELDRLAPFYDAAVALFDAQNPAPQLAALEQRVARGDFGALGALFAPSITKVRASIDHAIEKRQDVVDKLTVAANR